MRELLTQGGAAGLVLDHGEVYALAHINRGRWAFGGAYERLPVVLAVPVLALLLDLGHQGGETKLLLPAIQEHDPWLALHPESAPHAAGGWVGLAPLGVVALLAEGGVQGHDDVVERGEGLAGRPQPQVLALDDAVLFAVEHLGVDLLPADLGALVLHDLFREVGREVLDVDVRARRADDGVGVLHQALDERDRLRGGGGDLPGVVTQAHRESHHVPGVLGVLAVVAPGGQLICPGAVPLRAAEPARLLCGDAGDQGAVVEDDLLVGLVVALDQGWRDNRQKA